MPAKPHLTLAAVADGSSSREWTDPELVEAVGSGDPTCARPLYRRILPAVERALIRVLGVRDEEHDDLVQAALEQVVKSLVERRFAGACSLPTWAATIAARVGLAELRRRYRQRALFTEGAAAVLEEVAAPHSDQSFERVALVRQALAMLNRERALVLVMHDVEGYSLREIAATMGASVAAVQSRLVRGRKQFTNKFDTLVAASRESGGEEENLG